MIHRFRILETHIDCTKTVLLPVVLAMLAVPLTISVDDEVKQIAVVIASAISAFLLAGKSIANITGYEKEKDFILDLRDIISEKKNIDNANTDNAKLEDKGDKKNSEKQNNITKKK